MCCLVYRRSGYLQSEILVYCLAMSEGRSLLFHIVQTGGKDRIVIALRHSSTQYRFMKSVIFKSSGHSGSVKDLLGQLNFITKTRDRN